MLLSGVDSKIFLLWHNLLKIDCDECFACSIICHGQQPRATTRSSSSGTMNSRGCCLAYSPLLVPSPSVETLAKSDHFTTTSELARTNYQPEVPLFLRNGSRARFRSWLEIVRSFCYSSTTKTYARNTVQPRINLFVLL